MTSQSYANIKRLSLISHLRFVASCIVFTLHILHPTLVVLLLVAFEYFPHFAFLPANARYYFKMLPTLLGLIALIQRKRKKVNNTHSGQEENAYQSDVAPVRSRDDGK